MINVFEPSVSLKDKYSVLINLLKNNISGTSPVVGDFEKKTAALFERKYAVAVSNGSVALDVALQLINLEKDDEVIVPSFTIVSCLNAILRTGAKPIFCDVNLETWNMELAHVEEKFSSKTKAVLMVHTYGLTAEAKEIKNFCNDKNIILIEDTAEAHGQQEQGFKCGSFGDIATLSFYANKHITTGEGGMVLLDSEKYFKKAKQMINLDFNTSDRFQHENVFWNYRLSGLQAALGISQIDSLSKTIRKKISQGEYYSELLSQHKDILMLPLNENNGSKNHYWVYGVVIMNEIDRNLVTDKLLANGIQTRPFFWPLHLQNCLPSEFTSEIAICPNSEFIGRNGFYLPIGNHLKKKDQKFIVDSLISILHDNI